MLAKMPPDVDAFNKTLHKILTVSRADYERYEKQYRRETAKNPRKPGPKGKHVSRGSGVRG